MDNMECPSCKIIGPSGPFTDWHVEGDLNCQVISSLRLQLIEMRVDRNNWKIAFQQMSSDMNSLRAFVRLSFGESVLQDYDLIMRN